MFYEKKPNLWVNTEDQIQSHRLQLIKGDKYTFSRQKFKFHNQNQSARLIGAELTTGTEKKLMSVPWQAEFTLEIHQDFWLQNHRMAGVGRDCWRASGPTPSFKQGHPEFIAQDHAGMPSQTARTCFQLHFSYKKLCDKYMAEKTNIEITSLPVTFN